MHPGCVPPAHYRNGRGLRGRGPLDRETPLWTDTLWKHNLRKLRLQAVIMLQTSELKFTCGIGVPIIRRMHYSSNVWKEKYIHGKIYGLLSLSIWSGQVCLINLYMASKAPQPPLPPWSTTASDLQASTGHGSKSHFVILI